MLRKSNFKILIFSILILTISKISAQEKVVDKVLAVVGGKIILQSDVENQYIQLTAQGYNSGSDLKCELLEELLFQKLLLNEAIIDSIEVSESQVEQALDRRLRMFVAQIGSEEKLEEYFNKSILEIKADLRDLIKDQLLTQQMQEQITADIKITPSEVKKFLKDIPKDSLPLINSEIELAQIVRFPKISESEKIEVKERLHGLRERVVNGSNFSTLAILYSEDPGSAKGGGDLGYIGRSDVVSEFAAVAFNLREKNEVSKIVETDFGYHIIQLIDRKGEKVHVRHILLIPKVSPIVKMKAIQQMDSIANLIKNDSISFEEAAGKFSEDEISSTNGGIVVNDQTGTTKFESTEIEKSTYYAIKNLEINEISKTFETKDERGKLSLQFVKINSRTEPHVANIKSDYLKIQQIALEEKKQKEIEAWVNEKIENTYIRIDDSYKNCKFMNKNWVN
ncbi:MAG: peptidylprolyl isomerase [Bacteroidetes bacterium]|jgi:peptidyl-prolyl cis-trans isomerase SurA|nr:peptidylprolyl isomerase [Bacteroidota bacterium]MBT6686268.1 peptidylprolyl isomerase [Bacteroidota bacterium]MBT7142638.1 peptidylprolyl isomerase [Bacteroidota bacterium]MBT7492776.1 peptidylprolyl isomerase [Bacteroidota bacterium]